MWNAQSHQIWRKSRPVAFNLASDKLWPRFHRLRPRTDVLEPLLSIARNHIVGIDTEVDAIDVVCIERKRDRT
jgi:hypothetical protein